MKKNFKTTFRQNAAASKGLRFFKISLFCFTVFLSLEKASGQDWLSQNMRSINPSEFLSSTEEDAYYDALHAMVGFYQKKYSYDEYRGAVEKFANGKFFRSGSAQAELKEIDLIGREKLEATRDKYVERIMEEASKRDITDREFWALEVLYEKYNLDGQDSWPRFASGIAALSSNQIKLMEISAAGDALGLLGSRNNIIYLDSNKPLVRYWRRIYDGMSKHQAEALKVQEEYNEQNSIDNASMQMQIRNLEDEIKRLKNR